jgi:hypothetical protein
MFKTIFLVGIIGISSLTGYSSHASSLKENHIKLEGVDSSSVHINKIYLQNSETTLELRGEIKQHFVRSHPRRFSIQGHLDIELMDINGAVFKTVYSGYKQKPTKSGFAKFYLLISDDVQRISVIRVIHHETRSHTIDDS